MIKPISAYNPDYPYSKEHNHTGSSAKGYPIIERTMNGLLYPEVMKDDWEVDTNDKEEED